MCNLSGYVEEKGIERGDKQRQKKTVLNMLKAGTFSDQAILAVAEISQEELKELKKELHNMNLFE